MFSVLEYATETLQLHNKQLFLPLQSVSWYFEAIVCTFVNTVVWVHKLRPFYVGYSSQHYSTLEAVMSEEIIQERKM